MQLDEEFLASEAQLADLGPRERVDFGVILEDKNSHVSDGQLQRHALVILASNRLTIAVMYVYSCAATKLTRKPS